MSESQRRVKAFGEIALGVGDLDARRRFDREVVGLELMRRLAPEKMRRERLGRDVSTAEHAWVHRRSRYVTDPKRNTVEWVC